MLKPTESAVYIFFWKQERKEVPEEEKSCKAKNRGEGVRNKYRERGNCKYIFLHPGNKNQNPDSVYNEHSDHL